MSNRVLIFNAYSAANRGDGLIVSRMSELFAERGHEVRVMSDDPDDEGRYPGERIGPPIDAWKAFGVADKARLAAQALIALVWPRRMNAHFDWADLCVSAGGGYLYDDGRRAARMNLVLRLLAIRLACSAKGRVVLFSQSVGPFRSRAWAKLVGVALRKVDLVIARDQASGDLARSLGAQRVEVCDDIAFTAVANGSEQDALRPAAYDQETRLTVGVTVLDELPGRDRQALASYQQVLAAALVTAFGEGGATIRVVSQVAAHESDSDERAGKWLAAQLRAAGVHADFTRLDGIDDRAILEWYRKLDLMVASRLHSAILALSVGVPAVALGYLPKTAGVYERLGLSDLVEEIRGLTEEQLASKLSAAARDLDQWRHRVRTAMQAARIDAMRAVDLTLALME